MPPGLQLPRQATAGMILSVEQTASAVLRNGPAQNNGQNFARKQFIPPAAAKTEPVETTVGVGWMPLCLKRTGQQEHSCGRNYPPVVAVSLIWARVFQFLMCQLAATSHCTICVIQTAWDPLRKPSNLRKTPKFENG